MKTVYFTGYVDDNTPFAVSDNIKDVIKSLKTLKSLELEIFRNLSKI